MAQEEHTETEQAAPADATPEAEPAGDADKAAPGEAEALGPVLTDALSRVLAVARVQARGRLEDAAKRARHRLDLYQARRDLDRLYQKLGREVLHLVEAGEVTHPGLVRGVERIRRQEETVTTAAEQMGVPADLEGEE